MKTILPCLLLLAVASLSFHLNLQAADDVIILQNGKRYSGRTSRINNMITIQTRGGDKHFFRADEIKHLYKGEQLVREYKHRRGQLKPGDHIGEFNLARWCLMVGQERTAINWFARAIKSDNPKLLREVIKIASERNWDSLAEAALQQGTQLAPSFPYFKAAAAKTEALRELDVALERVREAATANQREIAWATKNPADATVTEADTVDIQVFRSCPACGIGRVDQECKTCDGHGLVPQTVEIQVPRPDAIPDTSISLERRRQYAEQLDTRLRELETLAGRIRTSLLDADAKTPRFDRARLAVPSLNDQSELTEALGQARTADDYHSVMAMALKKLDLDVASRAASLGLGTAPNDEEFKRLAKLAGALQRVQLSLANADHAIAEQRNQLQKLAAKTARLEWMLKDQRGFGAKRDVKCPRCHGSGFAPDGMPPGMDPMMPPEAAPDTDAAEVDGDVCPLCNGKKTVTRAQRISREELQQDLSEFKTNTQGTLAYIKKLQAYRTGMHGLVAELSRKLATGSDDLPRIKRAWLELPEPNTP